jgi:excinuclease UvrABC ATPase subunit
VVAAGPPESLLKNNHSLTGKFLAKYLQDSKPPQSSARTKN